MASKSLFNVWRRREVTFKRVGSLTRTWFPSSQAYRQATTAASALNACPMNDWFLLSQGKPSHWSDRLINFTSTDGKRLFRGAMDQGHAESFFKLMGNFAAQPSPILSGAHSLAMALNALEIDPKRTWKGNWRWFAGEQMETCSSPGSIHRRRGIPFDEFACMAQSHCDIQKRRASVVGYRQFLADLDHVTSHPEAQMVVHYARSALGQQGPAHFSPIGGHNKTEKMVLVMDVAQAQYSSVWVDTQLLYEAMLDREETGHSRGYFVLRPGNASRVVKCANCCHCP